jgi:beta-phosphoglucomutase family hydrolase
MKGIIFDLDGTMIDNMMIHHQAWQRKLASLGLHMTIEEVMDQIHGINEEIVLRLFGDKYSAEERARISWEKEKEYRDIFANQLQLLPGLPEFLQRLKQTDIPLAIGTAAPPENVDFVLDNLDIRSLFKSVINSKDVSLGKPNPEVFLKSAENIGIPIEDCLVFEDSVVGAETALNAGCPVVVVTTTHQRDEFTHFPHVIKFIQDYHKLQLEDLARLH